MKNFLLTSFIALIVSAFGVFAMYNYVPLKVFEITGSAPTPTLGSSITQILGTDTISSSRTTINNNFNALNVGKLENATTTASLNIGLLTVGSLIATTSSATSTFAGGAYASLFSAPYFYATSSTATSTFANGINMTGGCLFVNGLCLTSAVSSVSNSNGSLTISPITGAVISSINLANPNAWSATQSFTGGFRLSSTSAPFASSSPLTVDANGSIQYAPPAVAEGVATQAIGTTGNQIITHGLGRIPYYVEIEAASPVRFLVNGTDSYCGLSTSFGHATSTAGTTQAAVFSGAFFLGPGTAQIIIASTTQSSIINFPDNGAEGDVEASAQLTAMTSTTFTLNWNVNDAASAGCTDASRTRSFHWKAY